MTPAQLTVLAAALRADTNPDVAAAVAIGNATYLVSTYNTLSTYIVWRSVLTPDQARDAIVSGAQLAQLDNLTVGKRDALLYAFAANVNTANQATREAILDLCGTQNVLKAALTAAVKRAATQAEKLFATGTGTDATPGDLGWEGQITIEDVGVALRDNPA